jgi:hypothetical protein
MNTNKHEFPERGLQPASTFIKQAGLNSKSAAHFKLKRRERRVPLP